jgi:hypothetical protein
LAVLPQQRAPAEDDVNVNVSHEPSVGRPLAAGCSQREMAVTASALRGLGVTSS